MVYSRGIDTVLAFCFSFFIINILVLDIQLCLPSHLLPNFLIDFYSWYIREFDDYLFIERPNFFIGVIALESLVHVPLSIANAYGLFTKKAWSSTTCLIQGVSTITCLVAIIWDMVGSQKASRRMFMIYPPFMGFGLLMVVRGLYVPVYTKTTITHDVPKTTEATKKRA
ncbi:hypothetical protein AQUCO_07900011v1 [Aquilegia coerulea]|uniref:EXPERA domain-containing protein n=1 Tax=Aquilegia coerulea TaxID=218851 RepID=A0A2G5C7X3_AQUCA|nr:hypothetical protein AQUCO_07900011v1 [Aquilegia coerulea]